MAKSNKLFKDINVSNKVSRNGFDLSFSNTFSAKCGELLPLMHRDLMFGDKVKIRVNTFTRTRPVQTAAFTSINEYFDFFFVPYRVLGKQLPHILAQDKDNPTTALSMQSNNVIGTSLPHMPYRNLRQLLVPLSLSKRTNEFGYYRSILSSKLLNYLGYCYQPEKLTKHIVGLDGGELSNDVSMNLDVSLLPLAAYQKIYYDYYRNTQWENNVPYNYNFDYLGSDSLIVPPVNNASYWNNPTMFDLRYANYPKDLFFGILPDSQYGDTSVVDVDIDGRSTISSYSVKDGDGKTVYVGSNVNIDNVDKGQTITSGDALRLAEGTELSVNISGALSKLSASFDILEFRKARFVQKYREIIGTGKKNYKSIVQKVFNVELPDTLTDECYYLGGHSNVIKINEVENTNLADGAQAIQKGKGLGSSDSQFIEYEVKEPGIIMCIYHAVPQIDFALNAFHFDVVKTQVDDFANPIFDKLGLQEFPVYFLDNSAKNHVDLTPFIGWTTRYFDYKTSVDVVNGMFRDVENYKTWVAPLTNDSILQYMQDRGMQDGIFIDYRFFKVNPSILDPIFDFNADSFIDSDQLVCKCHFEFHRVTNLDYLGIPQS